VTVEKLVYGGDGLARLDGRVVLAPFVLPGERIRAAAWQEKPGLVKARTLEVLEPASDRVTPPCPYFARCGGCHYQHAPYEFQLRTKREILVEEIRRLGKLEPPGEIEVVAGEPWGYRNRVQLQVEKGLLGYREARSHKLCPITHCPVSSPRINEGIAALSRMVKDGRWPRFIRSVELFTDEEKVQLSVLETDRPVARRFFDWCAEEIPGLVTGALDYEGRFQVSRSSFFQVNRFLAGRLVATALAGATGERALDLYSGVGLFTLPLARTFTSVTAVESGTAAVRDLEFNATRAGLSNVQAQHSNVEESLGSLDASPDLVLADPPRSGLGKAVVGLLLQLGPPRITIVACDPATLARDLQGLTAGGYSLERLTLLDLFPQTYHLEAVAHLTKRT
jgi:23S rRNA (uracil1939-C5)-methyltransferase